MIDDKLNPIKSHEEQVPGPSFRDWPPFPHVLVDLFSPVAAWGALWAKPPPTVQGWRRPTQATGYKMDQREVEMKSER